MVGRIVTSAAGVAGALSRSAIPAEDELAAKGRLFEAVARLFDALAIWAAGAAAG